MKKKIVNIIFNVPLLLTGVTFLFIKEYITGIILLAIMCVTFYYITTSSYNNINRRIRNVIIAYIIIFILYFIIDFVKYTIDDYKDQKIFDEDINKCYSILNEEHNYKQFEYLVKKHNSDFKEQAYSILENLIDEKIEQEKLGTIDNEFIDMITQSNIDKDSIKEKIELLKEYNKLVEVDNYINNNDYIEADDLLTELINDTDNSEIKDKATSKQNEIKEFLIEQVINKGQELIDKNDYTSAKTFLSNYKNLQNEQITNMYNDVLNYISKENQEKIEKERFDYEVYCYFNLIAWKDKSLNDDEVYSECAKKFGITKEQAKESYNNVKYIGYSYQDKYPDIFEKYQEQY